MMRDHFTPTRTAIIFCEMESLKCWQGLEKLEPLCIADGDGKRCGYCGKQFGSSSESETQDECNDPTILLLGTPPKEIKTKPKKTVCLHVHRALFIVTKEETAPMSINRQHINELQYIHTLGYYSALKGMKY